ncbi:MAG: alpha/beta hydrolase [Pseudomonadota bacterium]|nr:alpha/beta hydrolase [Pseudomonadota bacterium]
MRRTTLHKVGLATLGAGLLAAAGVHAQSMPPSGPQGQPGIAFSGVAPVPENQAVLDALKAMNLRPYFTLTPQAARLQPSFTDGVMAVMRARGMPTAPPPGTTERDINIGGGAGAIRAKVVTPTGVRGPLPVILYFHGGGWVLADPTVYAPSARGLARQARAIVVSVDYRRAPEAPFPAQHDDALASYRWLLANAASIGGDPSRIALAGESAGGNLAVATAMLARDAGLPAARHILSVYPIAGNDLNTPSYRENSNAMPLNRALMAWFFHYTATRPADLMDPRINLVGANLAGLPAVTIVAAQIDPLRSEGELLAARLRAAGVGVERREWAGVTHEFFGAAPLIPAATEAQAWASERLRAALWSDMPPPAIPAPGPVPSSGERG